MRKKFVAGLLTLAMLGVMAAPITVKAEDWVSSDSLGLSVSDVPDSSELTNEIHSSNTTDTDLSSASGSSESESSSVDWDVLNGLVKTYNTYVSSNGSISSFSFSDVDAKSLGLEDDDAELIAAFLKALGTN